jgi:hypothetical protein
MKFIIIIFILSITVLQIEAAPLRGIYPSLKTKAIFDKNGKCNICKGTGIIKNQKYNRHRIGSTKTIKCKYCKGTGYKVIDKPKKEYRRQTENKKLKNKTVENENLKKRKAFIQKLKSMIVDDIDQLNQTNLIKFRRMQEQLLEDQRIEIAVAAGLDK